MTGSGPVLPLDDGSSGTPCLRQSVVDPSPKASVRRRKALRSPGPAARSKCSAIEKRSSHEKTRERKEETFGAWLDTSWCLARLPAKPLCQHQTITIVVSVRFPLPTARIQRLATSPTPASGWRAHPAQNGRAWAPDGLPTERIGDLEFHAGSAWISQQSGNRPGVPSRSGPSKPSDGQDTQMGSGDG